MPPTYTLTTEKTWSATLDDLAECFRKWPGVRNWSVTPTNPGRRASNRYQSLSERTVVLSYNKGGQDVTLTMDKQDRAVDNLRVLYLVVEALRMNEARGLAETAAAAYRQTYPALPAPGQTAAAATAGPGAVDPYAVLYVLRSAPLVVCEAAYRVLAKADHPDHGGAGERILALNVAIEAIRKERKG